MSATEPDAGAEIFQANYNRLREQISRVIVGHTEIIDQVMVCLLAGGHALLEGVPGLGKTLLVRTLAQALDVTFSRIQFTPDLMPADILGTNIVVDDGTGRKRFEFQQGQDVFFHRPQLLRRSGHDLEDLAQDGT